MLIAGSNIFFIFPHFYKVYWNILDDTYFFYYFDIVSKNGLFNIALDRESS